ncbi:hypothetical protein GN956_G25284 [Arapaima gigas]
MDCSLTSNSNADILRVAPNEEFTVKKAQSFTSNGDANLFLADQLRITLVLLIKMDSLAMDSLCAKLSCSLLELHRNLTDNVSVRQQWQLPLGGTTALWATSSIGTLWNGRLPFHNVGTQNCRVPFQREQAAMLTLVFVVFIKPIAFNESLQRLV